MNECAVVGVDDDILGQALVGVFVLQDFVVDTASAAEVAAHNAEILEFLRPRLAHYKRRFKSIHYVREIPRNALGKINKKTLLTDLKLSNN